MITCHETDKTATTTTKDWKEERIKRGISRFAKTQHTHTDKSSTVHLKTKGPDDHYACHPRLQPDVAACSKQKQGDRSAFFSTGTNDERCSVVAQTCFTGPFCNTNSHPKEMTIVYYHCVGLWLKQLPPKTSPPLTLAPLLNVPQKEMSDWKQVC